MRFVDQYKKKIVPSLKKEFKYSSIMAVPKLEKITVNMGVGGAVSDKKILDSAMQDLMTITSQKPVLTRARKSVAGFKIRAGWPIGCKVILRRDRMYEFLERLVHIAIPRVRDFRGMNPKGFDGRGNYNFGLNEQIVFPEIDYDKIDSIRGMDISIATSAKTNKEGLALLSGFNFPFKKS